MTTLPTTIRRRAAAALVAGALATGGLGHAPAHAAIPVDRACPAHTPEDGFTDTGLDGTAVEHAIDCLVAHGTSSGRTSSTYDPRALVTRGQLATFVLNVLDRVDGFAPPAAPTSRFPDVAPADTHGTSIDRAAALGVVSGFGDGLFRPELPVSRAQMATFLVNTLQAADLVVPAGTDSFTDDDGNHHEANIDSLRALDVVEGVGLGRYEPHRSVRRDTMALYLTRTLEVLVRAGAITPFPLPGPTLLDVLAADAGVLGLVDAGDVLQVVFSEPVAVTADDVGQRFRLADGDGSVGEVTCGVGAACVLQGPGTYQGRTVDANQVLRIHLQAPVEALVGFAGSVPGLQYPVTITNVSDGVVNLTGRPLVLGDHGDATVDTGALTPPPPIDDGRLPNMYSAVASESRDIVTIRYSEAVICESGPSAASSFSYVDLDNEGAPARWVECDGSMFVTVGFDDGVIEEVDATQLQVVVYDDPDGQADANDVRDLSGNQAAVPDDVGVLHVG